MQNEFQKVKGWCRRDLLKGNYLVERTEIPLNTIPRQEVVVVSKNKGEPKNKDVEKHSVVAERRKWGC